MSYSTTSKYVQLSPYLVMEFLYADQPNPESYFVNTGTITVGYDKLVNGILEDINGTINNDVQIFNADEDSGTTKNTRNNSVVKVTDSSFISLNPNLIIPYNDFNSALTDSSSLPITFPSNINVMYDNVRYHILAGYNLENMDGLILTIQYPDVDGSYVTISQIKLSKGTVQEYTLNPSPLTIGSNIFDKYFEVKIPSMSDMNNKYNAASDSNKPNTLSGLISKSGGGFIYGSPIRIKVYSILNTTKTSGYDTYGTQVLAMLSLESSDPFGDLGAYIAPSDTGDFFEYFATDNGGFPEDFILFQNSIGNSYYIEHSVEVLEQVGAAFIRTSNFTSIQTGSYDSANLFRPIIRYASNAVSFALRYTMTLINSKDQSRLIRIATYTSNEPSRYGSYIAPLALSVLPQQQKIYNKVTAGPTFSIPTNIGSVEQITKYSNVFIEKNMVNTSISTLRINGSNITEINADTAPISYGLGKVYITISPFDNYYKFVFYKKYTDGSTQEIDLASSGTYSMVFINNQNKKVFAPSIDDKNLANPGKGELAFKVDEVLSLQVLQFTNKRFYVSNSPAESSYADSKLAISKVSGLSRKLAKRSTSASDSINDVILASKDETSRLISDSTKQNSAKITSKSTSVLYWGNWITEDEQAPQVIVSNPGLIIAQENPIDRSSVKNVGKSSWQITGNPISDQSASTSGTVGTTTTGGKLTSTQLTSAIASDVQGKISLNWTVPEIIEYFLNPASTGYNLYVGITKQIFTDAVSGIFSSSEMLILGRYGNTDGGITDGGPAATGGGRRDQTGADSGSPNFPIIN